MSGEVGRKVCSNSLKVMGTERQMFAIVEKHYKEITLRHSSIRYGPSRPMR